MISLDMGIFKRTKTIVSHFDSKGQGTLEYILLLVVLISIAVGVLNHFFKPFGNYIKGVTSTELKCALETGELMGSERLREEGCVPKYEASRWNPAIGSSANGGRNDGTSGPTNSSGSPSSSGSSSSGSDSSKSKSGKSSGSSSSSSGSSSPSSGSSSGSDSSGNSSSSSGSSSGSKSDDGASAAGDDGGEDDDPTSNRGGRGKVRRIVGRNGKLELGPGSAASAGEVSNENSVSYEIGEEDSDKFAGNRGWKNRNRNKPRAITGYGLIEEEKEKLADDKKNASGSTKSVKADEGREAKTKQLKLQNKAESKSKEEVEESWGLGKWLRIAVMVLIILVILIFLFFQVMQISKGFEKN